MFKYRDTCQMRVVVAMETQLFHACCNDNWSLYMHTTIKIQSRELFHYFTIIIVQWFMIKKKFTITTPMSRFATILSTTVWRVQDKTTMTSINIKDQQVRVTIESYAKKKKKKTTWLSFFMHSFTYVKLLPRLVLQKQHTLQPKLRSTPKQPVKRVRFIWSFDLRLSDKLLQQPRYLPHSYYGFCSCPKFCPTNLSNSITSKNADALFWNLCHMFHLRHSWHYLKLHGHLHPCIFFTTVYWRVDELVVVQTLNILPSTCLFLT